MATSANDLPSLTIGSGVTAKGVLHVPGKATVYGTIEGELTADEVLVGSTGKVQGSRPDGWMFWANWVSPLTVKSPW